MSVALKAVRDVEYEAEVAGKGVSRLSGAGVTSDVNVSRIEQLR
jgi:hypothetical protein